MASMTTMEVEDSGDVIGNTERWKKKHEAATTSYDHEVGVMEGFLNLSEKYFYHFIKLLVHK